MSNTINLLETVKGFTKLSIPKFLLIDDKFSLFLRHTYREGGGEREGRAVSHVPQDTKKSSRVAKFQKYIDRVAIHKSLRTPALYH